MEIQISYQILLVLWVFDTPHKTATNSACQLSDHGILFIFFIINCQTLFQYSFSLSHSICLHLENKSLEELVSCNNTSVNWRYQHHWFIPIIIIIIFNLHTYLCRHKILPDVFISYWFSSFSCNHRISSPWSVTCTYYPSASFVSVAIVVWKVFNIFRKRMISWKHVLG